MNILVRSVTFARGLILSYGPTQAKKAVWNKEFTNGKWDFINETSNDCIYSNLEKHARRGSILDLGCGPGNTANELAEGAYQTYVGVDIAEAALAKAEQRTLENGRDKKNSFVCSDFLSYSPDVQFDVILFRESMYHIPYGKVLKILDKYSKCLKANGVFIVRLYSADQKSRKLKYRVMRKISLIERKYEVLEEARYETRGLPRVLVFRPYRRTTA
jgi:SAM-dependent methyltransferase